MAQAAQFTAAKLNPAKAQTVSVAAHLADIEDQDGPKAAYAALQARLRLFRAEGATVPPELATLEQRLVAECCAMSQGR
jgi:hypothetical protein